MASTLSRLRPIVAADRGRGARKRIVYLPQLWVLGRTALPHVLQKEGHPLVAPDPIPIHREPKTMTTRFRAR